MSRPENSDPGTPPRIEEFLGEPTRELGRWTWLWRADKQFPIRSHRPGLLGRFVVFLKQLGRPVVKAPQADLWDRQKAFNLVVLEYLERIEALGHTIESVRDDLVRDLTEVRTDLLRDVQNNHRRVSHLEAFKRDGFGDVMRHSDALYAVVDQKLDKYRRESEGLKSKLGALLALAELEDSSSVARTLEKGWNEQAYIALEDRFRGTEREIGERVEVYLPFFPAGESVLDLGCGRGEALAVLASKGVNAKGIDSSAEMVRHCIARNLDARQADLLDELSRREEGSLGGIISLHVIEHLPEQSLFQLIRRSWRALRPGGVLILETPNPLSLVVSARNFWRDPTHRRPIHPETLAFMFEQAGFDPVERLDLSPFKAEERLPEVNLADLSPDAQQVGQAVNVIRDRLDSLLHGYQDYAIVGKKPG